MKKKELRAAYDREREKAEKLTASLADAYRQLVEKSNQIDELCDQVDELCDLYTAATDTGLPVPTGYIFHTPATVTKWSDGTKTVCKAREGDEYDPVFGMLACALRKITRNRGHAVDEYEPALRAVASGIRSADDIDQLIEVGMNLVGALMVIRDGASFWYPELGPDDDHAPADDEGACPLGAIDHVVALTSEHEIEMMRQTIRNLIDAGEL